MDLLASRRTSLSLAKYENQNIKKTKKKKQKVTRKITRCPQRVSHSFFSFLSHPESQMDARLFLVTVFA